MKTLVIILISLLVCMFTGLAMGQVKSTECVTTPVDPNDLLAWETIEVNQLNPSMMFLLVEDPNPEATIKRACVLVHMRYGIVRFAVMVEGVLYDYGLYLEKGCFVELIPSESDKKFLMLRLFPGESVPF